MIRKITKRLTDTSTWAASSDLTAVNLPRDGIITEVGILASITMNTGTLATNQPDGLRRVIQNLKIEGDGGRAYLGLSGEQTSRLLSLLNSYELHCPMMGLLDAITEPILFVFHPGSNPRDPFDLTGAIPAQALSTLQAKLTTTANDTVDDTSTISSGTYYYYVRQVLGMPIPPGLMTPMGSTLTWAIGSAYSDFSYEIDVPAGAWLRRILMLVQDETATRPVRKDDQVTGVRLRMPKTGEIVLEMNWNELKLASAALYGCGGLPMQLADSATGELAVPDGFAIIDLRNYANKLYGLDLTQYQTGDFKLGLTTATPTTGEDVIIYWDQLQPVAKQYIGK